MRRAELVEGIDSVVRALDQAQIADILEHFVSSRDRERTPTQKVLLAFQVYSRLAEDFNSAARKVAAILGLNELGQADFWATLMQPSERLELPYRTLQSVSFARVYLPKLRTLIENDIQSAFRSPDELPPSYSGGDLLTTIIVESEGKSSSPERLASVLVSVSLLYEACAVILGVPPKDLAVVACDSGSDKSFDFLGAAKVIECVKELILALWDRVVFYRERQMNERLDLIAKSLPIMEKLSDLVESNKIGPEEAELLRRKIYEGSTRFVEAGALIPEFDRASHMNPRQLMMPSTKLLTAGIREQKIVDGEADADNTPAKNSDDDDSGLNNLSPEDLKNIKSYLKDKKRQKGDGLKKNE